MADLDSVEEQVESEEDLALGRSSKSVYCQWPIKKLETKFDPLIYLRTY